jgi:SAM-dependent methyltransferase
MPTIVENRERWQQHKWAQGGDEWSPGQSAEGTDILWHRTVFPRVRSFLPTDTILEIGPGFGRWTQYLRHVSRRLILVDLSERCIDSCRHRFIDDDRIQYIVNDGTSLHEIEDASVDFIFSFDSLVHAEADAIGAYLHQAARKLKPGGAGFIHHSNLKDFVDPRTDTVRWFVTQRNWRAPSMSAAVFRDQCAAAGLACDSQEQINWLGRKRDADRHRLSGRCIPLTDCFSVFSLSETPARPTRVVANPTFVDEWRHAVALVDLYRRADRAVAPSEADADRPRPLARKLTTARSVQRSGGWRGIAALIRHQLGAKAEFLRSACAARVAGQMNRWFLRRHVLNGGLTGSGGQTGIVQAQVKRDYAERTLRPTGDTSAAP